MDEYHAEPLTHAGAVVVRTVAGASEFLLVTARDNSDDWVLPKGHIEPGEDPAAAAQREIREETGLEVTILQPVSTETFTAGGEKVSVLYYLARAAPATRVSSPEGRRATWKSQADAAARLRHPEARAALAAAAAALESGA